MNPKITALVLLLLTALVPYVQAQPCTGVGYVPTQFSGKPDPWPSNHPLPNDQLAAAYFARYGQHPGNPSVPEGTWVPGYFDEFSFVTYGSLENAGNASATGPGGEKLHPGCPTTTEQTDFAFAVPKGSPYVFAWYVSKQDGGTPDKPVTKNDPLKPCGPYSIPKSFLAFWPTYYTNPAPCLGATPACGDGHLDPGETCQSCPADAGACPPACPQLASIPNATRVHCVTLLATLKKAGKAGQIAALKDICNLLSRELAYQPVTP